MKVQDKRRAAPGRAAPESEGQAGAPEDADAAAEPVEAEIVEAVERQHDYLDDLRRLQAEFDNYRKRMMRDQAQIAERARAGLIERLLPILDNFERAVDHGDVSPGVELVYKDLCSTLADAGLEEIESEGKPFDPNVHEAVESSGHPDVEQPTVARVYRRGYRLGDRLLRAAMVGVHHPTEDSSQEEPVEQRAEG